MTYIYKITNMVNGKIYIGKTMFTIEKRFKEHIQDSKRERNKNRPLYRAMRKYGTENFSIEEIEKCENDLYACEREKYWIEYFGSFKNGYNATVGGDGKPYLDYDLVLATYQQIQNCTKVAKLLNMDAGSVSKIVRSRGEKIKPAIEVMKESTSKTINMYTLDDEYLRTFPSISEAARYICSLDPNRKSHSPNSHISDAAKGKRKSAYGYHWKIA